ncbi:MAG: hypothetical protein HYX48_01220 [Chlamydiales bacterium]|nr:hypothetical protein [Chlamydiales bacterium]
MSKPTSSLSLQASFSVHDAWFQREEGEGAATPKRAKKRTLQSSSVHASWYQPETGVVAVSKPRTTFAGWERRGSIGDLCAYRVLLHTCFKFLKPSEAVGIIRTCRAFAEAAGSDLLWGIYAQGYDVARALSTDEVTPYGTRVRELVTHIASYALNYLYAKCLGRENEQQMAELVRRYGRVVAPKISLLPDRAEVDKIARIRDPFKQFEAVLPLIRASRIAMENLPSQLRNLPREVTLYFLPQRSDNPTEAEIEILTAILLGVDGDIPLMLELMERGARPSERTIECGVEKNSPELLRRAYELGARPSTTCLATALKHAPGLISELCKMRAEPCTYRVHSTLRHCFDFRRRALEGSIKEPSVEKIDELIDYCLKQLPHTEVQDIRDAIHFGAPLSLIERLVAMMKDTEYSITGLLTTVLNVRAEPSYVVALLAKGARPDLYHVQCAKNNGYSPEIIERLRRDIDLLQYENQLPEGLDDEEATALIEFLLKARGRLAMDLFQVYKRLSPVVTQKILLARDAAGKPVVKIDRYDLRAAADHYKPKALSAAHQKVALENFEILLPLLKDAERLEVALTDLLVSALPLSFIEKAIAQLKLQVPKSSFNDVLKRRSDLEDEALVERLKWVVSLGGEPDKDSIPYAVVKSAPQGVFDLLRKLKCDAFPPVCFYAAFTPGAQSVRLLETLFNEFQIEPPQDATVLYRAVRSKNVPIEAVRMYFGRYMQLHRKLPDDLLIQAIREKASKEVIELLLEYGATAHPETFDALFTPTLMDDAGVIILKEPNYTLESDLIPRLYRAGARPSARTIEIYASAFPKNVIESEIRTFVELGAVPTHGTLQHAVTKVKPRAFALLARISREINFDRMPSRVVFSKTHTDRFEFEYAPAPIRQYDKGDEKRSQ